MFITLLVFGLVVAALVGYQIKKRGLLEKSDGYTPTPTEPTKPEAKPKKK
jgi:hypothetical protein